MFIIRFIQKVHTSHIASIAMLAYNNKKRYETHVGESDPHLTDFLNNITNIVFTHLYLVI